MPDFSSIKTDTMSRFLDFRLALCQYCPTMKYQSETFDAKKAYEVWKKSGRTQAWLAAQLGVGPEHVSKVLNGKSNPSYAVLKLLAAALETRLEDLMADSSAA